MIVVIAVAIFFGAAYLFLLLQGKTLVISQLAKLTHKNVTIEHFRVTPPLNINIAGLKIEDMAKVDSFSVSPSIIGLLLGQLAFNRIYLEGPEFTYEKAVPALSPEGTSVPVGISQETGSATAAAVTPQEEPPPAQQDLSGLVIKRIVIKNGVLHFIDHTAGEGGIKLTAKDINFSLTNFSMRPRPAATYFELHGKIPWGENSEKKEGNIGLEGWINILKKDMEATLKISDIDGIYLYPYYSKYVDLEKSRIESAKLNFTSNIHGIDNKVTAECHLELTDIIFRERSPEEQQEKAEKIAYAVLDIFKAMNQGKIEVNFTIRTRMDRPEFGFSSIKNAVENKLIGSRSKQNVPTSLLMLPIKLVEGTVNGATDLTTSVITGTIKAGGEIRKAMQDAFKKPTEPKKE